MNFIRPKKIVFCNNKGGVGKTTLLFNIALQAAKNGYRVAMVDLDPQTNLTMNVLGESRAEDLFNGEVKNIYDVLKGLETGVSDYDPTIKPYQISEGVYLVPGSLNLSSFEDKVLNYSFLETSQGSERGFRVVSAINRYLDKIALEYKLDLLFIDTSPNLGSINKAAILGSDFFVVPVRPDIFSVQGVVNIGTTYSQWKSDWSIGQEYVGKKLPLELNLKNDPVFLGWILNDYTPYDHKPAIPQQIYIDKLKSAIKSSLSSRHTKNGLFETTQNYLGVIQQFGVLMQRSQEAAYPICNMDINTISAPGSKQVYEKVKGEVEDTTNSIINLALKYQNI